MQAQTKTTQIEIFTIHLNCFLQIQFCQQVLISLENSLSLSDNFNRFFLHGSERFLVKTLDGWNFRLLVHLPQYIHVSSLYERGAKR